VSEEKLTAKVTKSAKKYSRSIAGPDAGDVIDAKFADD
jgi:hypothetical protein